MKCALTCVAIAASLSACSSDVDSNVLLGTWGSESIEVVATPNAVVMTFQCGAVVRINHPLELDAAGRFGLLDSLRGSIGGGPLTDTLPSRLHVSAAYITGTMSGDALTIGVQTSFPTAANPVYAFGEPVFTGIRGQPGTPTAGACRD